MTARTYLFIAIASLAWTPPGLAADETGCTLGRLAHLSPCELEQLYRSAAPGAMPDGFLRGRAIYCPDTFLAGPRSKATNFLWRGKRFADGTMVNQWRGFRAIHARVYYGGSALDGRPSIILDYCGMSHVWNDVRDEIREVCPGIYLGLMYRRGCPEPKFEMFFALEAESVACPAH